MSLGPLSSEKLLEPSLSAGRTSAKDPKEASAPHQDPLAPAGVMPRDWPAAREHQGVRRYSEHRNRDIGDETRV